MLGTMDCPKGSPSGSRVNLSVRLISQSAAGKNRGRWSSPFLQTSNGSWSAKRTQVFYNIEFATADNETISKSSGSCWEDAFEKCATQIVEDAKVAARRIESSR